MGTQRVKRETRDATLIQKTCLRSFKPSQLLSEIMSLASRAQRKISQELKVEDKWLEDFIKKRNSKYFGYLRRSEDLEKITDEEDRWEKRKRKTEKEMEKGHMGCF